MGQCDEIKYKDLDWCEGEVILPGLHNKVYAIPKRDILSWPTKVQTIVTKMGELVTRTGNFTLAAAAVWTEIGITVSKSPVTSASQGNKPSKTFLNTGVFAHQNVDEEASGFAQQANNDDMVYLVRVKNGKYRILGNEMFESDTAIAQNLGAAVTDEVGTIFTVTVTDISPAPFYTGEIVVEGGVINEVVGG